MKRTTDNGFHNCTGKDIRIVSNKGYDCWVTVKPEPLPETLNPDEQYVVADSVKLSADNMFHPVFAWRGVRLHGHIKQMLFMFGIRSRKDTEDDNALYIDINNMEAQRVVLIVGKSQHINDDNMRWLYFHPYD